MSKNSAASKSAKPALKKAAGNPPPASKPPTPGQEVVLLSLTGESPAILTETLWALAFPPAGVAPVIPARIVVITTTRGREEFSRQLDTKLPVFGQRTAWDALCGEIRAAHPTLNLPPALPVPRVITGQSDNGSREVELPDIRTPAHNDAAADFILEIVRGLSDNPDHRLIVSLAGGRKTMVALLYASVSLIGRETARITHVLVNAPFDLRLDPPFFFPPKTPVQHKYFNRETKLEEIWSSQKAKIELAEVQFVPLRNAFTEIGKVPGGFRGLIDRYGKESLKRSDHVPSLALREAPPALLVDGKEIKVDSALHLAVVATLIAVQPHLPADGKIDYQAFAEITKAFHGLPYSIPGNNLKSAQGIAQKVVNQAGSPRLIDRVGELDAETVTDAVSNLRTRMKDKLHLEWLKSKGVLRLPAHRIGSGAP